MKAIRGDNPRTTNQRVYLMPVVPPPPPEKPPTPDVEQFSLSFPPVPLSLYIGAALFYLSVYPLVPLSYLSLSFSLLIAPRRPSTSPPPPPSSAGNPYALAPASSRCCSRICHYATDITNPALPSLSLLLFSRVRSLVGPPSSPRFPAALFATCRTPAHPRDLAQSVLLY